MLWRILTVAQSRLTPGRCCWARADRAIGLIGHFAACFVDGRRAEYVEHRLATLVGLRVFGIALGYEDLNDYDELRHDPVMAVLAGKLEAGGLRRWRASRRSTASSWAAIG